MNSLFANSELAGIAEKVEKGERLSREDGIRLMKSNDLLTIGYMADLVRKRKNGDYAYFIVNRHVNHTNICENLCKLCAFGKKPDDPDAYTMTIEEIEEKARECQGQRISEFHIVGGLNPNLRLEYFEEMLRRVKKILPNTVIKAFTAVEIDYFARTENLSVEDVLRRLQKAGLDSLPGGGAEIFSPRVRKHICEKKISGERWLEVHETAHRIGMRTNATMLYGHIETAEERIDHLIKLRELQDKTGGFLAFIGLAFHPKNTGLEELNLSRTTGYDDIKVLAVARLMLDNFDHIKAYWIMIGPKLAQVSLAFGVDDIDGTVVEEKITHSAGADTGQSMTKAELVNMIKAAGRIPAERDTLYTILEEGF
ncbi:aminofutalosine synthase MqnE [Thermincola potens]|uniref:Aminodeoxyfutalosine synthase n=1 Tax=Thermincola potens (strain JR) TaxID=635013 RepID=D5X7Q1_THEPJ|nr:aminofutalosine synthase MqnE [Thermincola potens]ADG82621.1 Radical SAM domain protein [Thermincola potens JR]